LNAVAARLAWISIAPVKSLALAHPRQVRLEPYGVRENRRFYLVDEDGRLANGKRLGRLVQVAADYDEAGETLALRFPDGALVSGQVELGDAVETVFFGSTVEGRLVLGPWAEALSDFAGRPLRLVRANAPGAAVDRGRKAAVSLVSTGSLEALARAAGLSGPVDGRRFRMLFGVEGVAAHEEDSWLGRRVRIGEAAAVLRGNVGRCATTTHNPDTGAPDLDTLRVLESYRGDLASTERCPFGVWGEVVEPGTVRVGDPVQPEP
jgi:uncharacterized protein YcbX